MAGPRAVDIFLPFKRTKEKPCSSPGGCTAFYFFFYLCLSKAPRGWKPGLYWIESKDVSLRLSVLHFKCLLPAPHFLKTPQLSHQLHSIYREVLKTDAPKKSKTV